MRAALHCTSPQDVFYPEFEQIRATGLLPTGRPVPGMAPPPPWGYGALPSPAAFPPWASPPPPAAAPPSPYQRAYAAQPSASGAAAYAVPPVNGFHGASSPYMPNGSPHGLPNGAAASPYGRAPAAPPAGFPAPPPKLGEPAHDSFASLAPALMSALPRGAPPSPPPAAAPAAPYHVPPAPPPPAPAPAATAAAGATLFGDGAHRLTSYDLTAPSAPKARASGNPFA